MSSFYFSKLVIENDKAKINDDCIECVVSLIAICGDYFLNSYSKEARSV